MANNDAFATTDGYSVGRVLIASVRGANVDAASNTAGIMPIFSGGLTNGGAVANSGGVIIRQVTFQNPSANISTANVAILTSDDGNSSNAVVSVFRLSNVSATGRFQDANIAAPYVSNVVSGSVTQALFLQVANSTSSGGLVDVKIYGDVVNF